MVLVNRCFEFSKPIIDAWPEQTDLTAKSVQGQFLYVQAYSAWWINQDYWRLRVSGLTDSCKILARHLFEQFLNLRVAVQNPGNALGCILYELRQQLKKYSERGLENHNGFRDLRLRTEAEIANITTLSEGSLIEWTWRERADKSGYPRAYLLYRHLCKYAHAGYGSWRPDNRENNDPLTDRTALMSLVDTAFQLHHWMHNPVDAKISRQYGELMREIETCEYGLEASAPHASKPNAV